MHKPQGYPDVSAYLIVPDAAAVLDFCAAAFNADRLRVIEREGGGGIMHAECRIGDSVVMMGEMPDGPPAHLHLYLADAEAAFDRAVAAGAEVIQPMQSKGDGDLRGGVRDASGTTWWIARQEEA
ncbi:VOC family protein [Roseovarius atlanticus]|uniref:VOC family protein n=1 Tax=Roseovarius atlanticus TaxID=1641875 RepID=UPI001C962985|nr:VOC family protein [Roseovarius atlanticus]MBY5990027.1 VOC family protein [Roseovarius atlanticus]MBY6126572.1 VOC family protein [Roseovarius atlanticus]MBY6151066.1 VOC family protein [Roseovarius atlanticus]